MPLLLRPVLLHQPFPRLPPPVAVDPTTPLARTYTLLGVYSPGDFLRENPGIINMDNTGLSFPSARHPIMLPFDHMAHYCVGVGKHDHISPPGATVEHVGRPNAASLFLTTRDFGATLEDPHAGLPMAGQHWRPSMRPRSAHTSLPPLAPDAVWWPLLTFLPLSTAHHRMALLERAAQDLALCASALRLTLAPPIIGGT